MEALRIVVVATLAAIIYGVVHDQVTARICVEYFTIGHPPILATTSPTLLGLGWGIVATWWVGLPLGVLLAFVARVGARPKLTARDLKRPMLWLLLAMAACAVLGGAIGGALASRGTVWLTPPIAEILAPDRHVPFLIDLWAHSASYLAGILGGLALTVWTWRRRGQVTVASA
jgi:hypothetical protein